MSSRDTIQSTRPHLSGLELLLKLWPVIVVIAGVIGAGYVGQYKLAESAERIARLEKGDGEAREGASKQAAELTVLLRVVGEQTETAKDHGRMLRRLERKLDRLCVKAHADCGGD